jgi:hypothetical protein
MTPPVSVEGEEKRNVVWIEEMGRIYGSGTQWMDRGQEQLLVRAMTHRLR